MYRGTTYVEYVLSPVKYDARAHGTRQKNVQCHTVCGVCALELALLHFFACRFASLGPFHLGRPLLTHFLSFLRDASCVTVCT